MPDQNRRTILSRQHAFGRGYGFRQRRQRVLHGCSIEPRCLQCAITSDQHDPSANNPCTRTTFRAFGAGCAVAARARAESPTGSRHAHERAAIYQIAAPNFILVFHQVSP